MQPQPGTELTTGYAMIQFLQPSSHDSIRKAEQKPLWAAAGSWLDLGEDGQLSG
jgi:hypothetical protein